MLFQYLCKRKEEEEIEAIMNNTTRLSGGSIPIDKKYALTIKEASEYFNIGTNKLYDIANDPYDDCFLRVGNHKLVKREKFSKKLDELFSL